MKKWALVSVAVLVLLAVIAALAPEALAEELRIPPLGVVRVFLKIEGLSKTDGIGRESQNKDYAKEIEVLSCQHGVTQAATLSTGGAGAASRAMFNDVVFTKYADTASTKLYQGCASGKHYPLATFTFVKSATTGDQPYLTLTLGDVTITSYGQAFQTGGLGVMETVSLAYARIKMEYTQVGPTGTPMGTSTGGWDLVQNRVYP